jgi:hypothetical protein
VIQVIGETSNKAGDPKKFVQTFVLAQQPSGYFVLNDILRFIDEERDEEPAEPFEQEAPAVEAEAPVPVAEDVKEPEPTEEQSVEEQPTSLDASVVDQKLEEVSVTPQEPASVNGDAAPEATAAEESAAVPEVSSKPTDVADEAVPEPEAVMQEVAEETVQEPEKPKDPSPTPVATRKPAAPVPAPAPAPAQPPKPMTWASRIAAAAGGPPKVSPAMPLPKAAPVPAATRPAAAAPTASSQTTASSTQGIEAPASVAPAKEAGAEWQTAGSDSKRQNRPQSISGPPAEKEGTLGYVKYVTDKVVREELEAILAQYGELAYFDINRQKVCVFSSCESRYEY